MAVSSPVGRVGDVSIVSPISTINFSNYRALFYHNSPILWWTDYRGDQTQKQRRRILCCVLKISCCDVLRFDNRGGPWDFRFLFFGFVVRCSFRFFRLLAFWFSVFLIFGTDVLSWFFQFRRKSKTDLHAAPNVVFVAVSHYQLLSSYIDFCFYKHVFQIYLFCRIWSEVLFSPNVPHINDVWDLD